MLKKDFFKMLGVLFLALAIGFSPYITIAQLADGRAVKIRMEDILIAILLVLSFFGFFASGKSVIKKPPLLYFILGWLAINFASTMMDLIFTKLYFTRSFFFFLKEVEFFAIYFYVFYYLKSLDAVKFLLKTWMFIGLVSALWIVYVIISGSKYAYFYGPNTFIEPEGTIASGGFFLIIFLFLFNVFLYYYSSQKISLLKKGFLFIVSVSPVIGVFSSGSRAALMGFVPAFMFTLFIYLIKKGTAKRLFFIAMILLVVFSIFVVAFMSSPYLKRFIDWDTLKYEVNVGHSDSRLSIWGDQLSFFLKKPIFLFWGFGTGVVLMYGESHSQYVRNIVEVGVIGSVLFFILLFAFVKESLKGYHSNNNLSVGLSVGFLASTIAMIFISLSTEPFILPKVAEVYWFFTALMVTDIYLLGKESKIYV